MNDRKNSKERINKEKMNQLLLLENRIIEDRRRLQVLVRQNGNVNPVFYNNKIEQLEQELDRMRYQLNLLKEEYNEAYSYDVEVAKSSTEKLGDNFAFAGNSEERTGFEVVRESEERRGFVTGEGNVNCRQDSYLPKKNERDLEKTFGKSFMGIFASVLIFISIILFATLLLPFIGNGAKMAITYIISGAFLGIGSHGLRRDKDNKFSIALTGCGLGALYISLMLSNMYFQVLGDVVLYVLIAFWGGLVCLYAKNRNYVFQIIGEVGIVIATVFGCMLSITNNDVGKYIALLIFYGITSGIFYIVNYEREFADNLHYHVFSIVNGLVITVASLIFEGEGAEAYLILTLILLVANLIGIMSHRLNKPAPFWGCGAAVNIIYILLISSETISDNIVWGLLVYIFGMGLVVLTERKRQYNKSNNIVLSGMALLSALIGMSGTEKIYNYGIVFLMIIPLIIFGYIRKYTFCKGAGLIITSVYIFSHGEITALWHFVFVLIALAVAYGCMIYFKEQYSKDFKDYIYIVTCLFILANLPEVIYELIGKGDMENAIANTITYSAFVIFSIICTKSRFARNFVTGELEKNKEIYVFSNLAAMGNGLLLISHCSVGWCNLVNICMVLAAFLLDCKVILNNKKDWIWNVYVGGKLTVFLLVAINAFEPEQYVISIACLILAIVFILIGFKGNYKYLRIYGLGLTMISIFKLIMVDVKYENTLGNAISFFISGILCFGISMIYNYLDKKMDKIRKGEI